MPENEQPAGPVGALKRVAKHKQTLRGLLPADMTAAQVAAWGHGPAQYQEALATGWWVAGVEDDKGKVRRADTGAAPPDSKQEDQ